MYTAVSHKATGGKVTPFLMRSLLILMFHENEAKLGSSRNKWRPICTSSNDLSCLPDVSFAFVENFITGFSSSSGKEQTRKGFKYYSEGYIHSLKLYEDGNECPVNGGVLDHKRTSHHMLLRWREVSRTFKKHQT